MHWYISRSEEENSKPTRIPIRLRVTVSLTSSRRTIVPPSIYSPGIITWIPSGRWGWAIFYASGTLEWQAGRRSLPLLYTMGGILIFTDSCKVTVQDQYAMMKGQKEEEEETIAETSMTTIQANANKGKCCPIFIKYGEKTLSCSTWRRIIPYYWLVKSTGQLFANI